jgi:ribose 5-phosphate isomerase A
VNLKKIAAEAAVHRVKDGMVVGLGTGSTVRYSIEKIGRLVDEGLDILGVPTSEATADLARSLGISLTTLVEHPEVDLTIDGADEVDPNLDLIKGMGGALFREKLVALASSEMIVVVDESKLVDSLGQKTPIPVEVLPFGWTATRDRLQALGCDPSLRRTDSGPFVTDNGNYILDCRFPRIDDPADLARRLKEITGVLEHGLFLGMADLVLVGHPEGVREMRRP